MEESGGMDRGSQGSPDISSPPDPTQAMPAFDSGKAVESMSPEEAAKEWHEMTLDAEGKYKTFPRSVFNERRSKLFERGFATKIEEEQKAQEIKNKEWLEGENRKLQERDEQEEIRKARSALVQHFGGEKKAAAAEKSAHSILDRFATKEDEKYIEENGLWRDPEFIQKLAEIGEFLQRKERRR